MSVSRWIKPPLRALRASWRAARALYPSAPPPTPAAAPPPPPPPVAPPPPRREVEIDVQETPNPQARKFVTDVRLRDRGSSSYSSVEEARPDPVARALFVVAGVRAVFIAADFVTVTKATDISWGALQADVMVALREVLADPRNTP